MIELTEDQKLAELGMWWEAHRHTKSEEEVAGLFAEHVAAKTGTVSDD